MIEPVSSVRSTRIALPDGITPGTIHVRDGKIAAIGSYSDRAAGGPEIDAGDMVVLPGLVDSHVHIDDPGRADWEGFDHATRAAAAGGVTTLVDMPLNSIPPTTTVEGLEAKRRAASGGCHVDVAFWGGLVPGNRQQLEPLARAGVRGFKCFLSPSGVDEFGHVTEDELREALAIVASLGLPLLAHAEWPALLRDPRQAGADPRRYRTWLESRPPSAELEAIGILLRLCAEFGVRLHIVHLATPDALAAIGRARQEGLQVSVETCPHYLTFAAEDIADGATAFKCAPPIREGSQREGLWRALADGRIDFIATDHSPSPPALKRLAEGDFVGAWGGIASLQLGLAAVWTGMAARGLPPAHLSRWLAAGPAALAGLSGVKGSIAAGCDADLVIWDPDTEVVVDASTLYHRHPVTPYDGARLRGRVRTTMLRGAVIYDEGRIVAPGEGRTM